MGRPEIAIIMKLSLPFRISLKLFYWKKIFRSHFVQGHWRPNKKPRTNNLRHPSKEPRSWAKTAPSSFGLFFAKIKGWKQKGRKNDQHEEMNCIGMRWKEEAFEEQVFLSSNGKLGGNCNDLKEKKAIFGHQPGPFRSGLLLRPEKATQGDNFLYYVFLCIHYAERQTINFYHILITVSVFSSRRQSESGKYTKDRSAGVAWKMVATYSVYTIVVIVPPEERRRAYGIISQYTQHIPFFLSSLPRWASKETFCPCLSSS